MHICIISYLYNILDSKVHGANRGPIWGQQDPGGPHVGPMNFAIWDICMLFIYVLYVCVIYSRTLACVATVTGWLYPTWKKFYSILSYLNSAMNQPAHWPLRGVGYPYGCVVTKPSHYLNQCWNIINWSLGDKLQRNFIQNSYIFIQENAFEKTSRISPKFNQGIRMTREI